MGRIQSMPWEKGKESSEKERKEGKRDIENQRNKKHKQKSPPKGLWRKPKKGSPTLEGRDHLVHSSSRVTCPLTTNSPKGILKNFH